MTVLESARIEMLAHSPASREAARLGTRIRNYKDRQSRAPAGVVVGWLSNYKETRND